MKNIKFEIWMNINAVKGCCTLIKKGIKTEPEKVIDTFVFPKGYKTIKAGDTILVMFEDCHLTAVAQTVMGYTSGKQEVIMKYIEVKEV